MAHAEDQQQLDQISRLLTTLGWRVIVTDLTGPKIRATIEHDKTATPTTPLLPPHTSLSTL